jgi:hypothetical protein
MTRWKLFLVAAGASLDLGGGVARAAGDEAQQQEQGTEQGDQQGMKQGEDESGGVGGVQTQRRLTGKHLGKLTMKSAKVEKVDLDKRQLTLRSGEGKPFTIDVPEGVTRLDNVKVGDRITASFYESVAVSLKPQAGKPAGAQETVTVEKAPGDLPQGTVIRRVTTLAKVTGLDRDKNEVTIQTSGGRSDTIEVQDPASLKRIKVGDNIRTTYTQAMATSVTRM